MSVTKLLLLLLVISTISSAEYAKLDLTQSWRMKTLQGPASV